MKTLSTGIIVVCLILLSLSGRINAQSVTIDMDSTYQLIRGFGGMNHTSWIKDLNEDQRQKAFSNEPGNIGLSILRVHINPDSTRFKLELPTALYATTKGAIVFATPWNAPSTMTEIFDSESHNRVRYNMYNNYVAHLNSFNNYMAKNSVPLHAISVQNEPDYGEWTRWTSNEMVTFMRENADDIENRVIASESYQFKRAYTDPILNDSMANAHLDIVGGHIYGAGLFDYPLAREKGKEVWMTEHLTGSDRPEDNTWSLALDLGTEITNCMKANFNAYVWWYIRRFYGLITDDGNISKKGFVMSQFTKFIRPGAVRVDGVITSAPNVDATAYKTDSSLVIVVVNKNSTSIDLSFAIKNGTIDTLTKFTTSATKNVVNDGGISISAGSFNSTVDAYSVTTFTSYSANAGKYGNVAPIAVAGSDIVILDTNGSGSEIIILDGSKSSDSDGLITNFNWSEDSIQWSLDTIFEYNATIGKHTVVLTVTDNDGARHSDTVNITVKTLKNTEIWLEAECGQVGSTWEIPSDAKASNGSFAMAPAGIESIAAASSDTADLIIFNFHVPETGNYKLWGRVITPNANDDSFWIRMDEDTEWAFWNSIPAGTNWHWEVVFDQNNSSQAMTYDLDTGYHSLSICFREDGAKLDKLFLTNKGSIPTAIGGVDSTCPEDSIPNNIIFNNEILSVSVFPNPAKSEIQIVSGFSFQSLNIFNIEGKKVDTKEFIIPVNNTILQLNLEPGIYILQLSNKQSVSVSKIVVK